MKVAVSVELKREYPMPTPKFSHTRIAPDASNTRPDGMVCDTVTVACSP